MLLRDVPGLPLLSSGVCVLRKHPASHHPPVRATHIRVGIPILLGSCIVVRADGSIRPAAVADDAVSQDGLEVSLGTLSCRSGRTSVHLRQMNFISDPSVPTGTSKLS